MNELDKYDQQAINDIVRRVGPAPILESLADHVLFQAAISRRKRDAATNQDAKARYRLLSRKLERASYRLAEISRDLNLLY